MYFHILLNTKIIIVWKQVGDFRSAISKFRFLHFQQRERERVRHAMGFLLHDDRKNSGEEGKVFK